MLIVFFLVYNLVGLKLDIVVNEGGYWIGFFVSSVFEFVDVMCYVVILLVNERMEIV